MSAGVRALIGRAATEAWGPDLERDVDDYENYLATQLERLEDMDPAHLPEGEMGQRLMDGLGMLIGLIDELRQVAENGSVASRTNDLLAAVDAADAVLRAP